MTPDFKECVKKLYDGEELSTDERAWIAVYLQYGEFAPTLDGQLSTMELTAQTLHTVTGPASASIAIELHQRLRIFRRMIAGTPDEITYHDRILAVANTLVKDGFKLDMIVEK